MQKTKPDSSACRDRRVLSRDQPSEAFDAYRYTPTFCAGLQVRPLHDQGGCGSHWDKPRHASESDRKLHALWATAFEAFAATSRVLPERVRKRWRCAIV